MRPRAPRRVRRPRTVAFAVGGRPAPWRRTFTFLFVVAMLFAAPLAARSQVSGPDSVSLTWTAPGDDGALGTATAYDLRVATGPITLSNWDQATLVNGVPIPHPAGSAEQVMVHGLTQGTVYYFALRTVDEAGNWSGLSNVTRWDWILDSSPPSAPTGLTGSRAGADVHLAWNPNTEPDVAGYSVYRAASAGGPWTRASDSLLAGPAFDDAAVPGGWSSAFYQVTATDASGNESAKSAALAVSLVTAPPPPASVRLEPPYPNPSAGADPVRIPLTVSAGGASGGMLDVLDAGGHRVRRLDLSRLAAGNQVVTWDGRNQAGRAVAPGVYTLRVDLGGDIQRVRIVRIP